MQLITNRIHTGKTECFEDFIARYKEEHQIKTASTEEDNVKVAAEKEEADSSGQLDVEPLHQTGESTEMPKKGPSAKKEDADGKEASATDTDPEEEGKDSGQSKAEGNEKFTNKVKFDPNDTPKSEKGGSMEEAQIKESGKLPEALEEHKFTKKDDKKDDDKEEKEASVKEAKKEDEEEVKEVEGKEEKEAGTEEADKKEKKEIVTQEEDKEAETKEGEKEEKKAIAKTEFVKFANLDAKNKKFLTDYWRQLFGDDYVNALVADK